MGVLNVKFVPELGVWKVNVRITTRKGTKKWQLINDDEDNGKCNVRHWPVVVIVCIALSYSFFSVNNNSATIGTDYYQKQSIYRQVLF